MDSASEGSDSEVTSDGDENDSEDDDKFGSGAVFGKVADAASNFVANLGGMAVDVMDKLTTLLGSRPSSASHNVPVVPVAGALLSSRPMSGNQSARSRPTSGNSDAVTAAAANFRQQNAATNADVAATFAAAMQSADGGTKLNRRGLGDTQTMSARE